MSFLNVSNQSDLANISLIKAFRRQRRNAFNVPAILSLSLSPFCNVFQSDSGCGLISPTAVFLAREVILRIEGGSFCLA